MKQQENFQILWLFLCMGTMDEKNTIIRMIIVRAKSRIKKGRFSFNVGT